MKLFNESRLIKLSYLLPKSLVMWCFIRVVNYATTGKYSNTIIPEITAMGVLKRFQQDNNL